jgi:NitT/TauT family transport system substrate-binding protein
MEMKNNHANRKTWKIAAIGIVAAIILIMGLVLFMGQPPTPPARQEPLTIATGSPEFSALTLVAQEKGYFLQHGLNVTVRDYPTGVLAINELLSGNADLAYAAEFVGVSTSFRPADFRIIASTAKSDVISLVIRNDRGISKPSDLKGRTIAFPKGTAAEFFLGRYLTLNRMNIRDVTVRYLAPAEMVTSVVKGDSDAAIIWEPYVYQIGEQLGRNSTTWQAQGGQRFYWVAYTRPDVIRDRPVMIRQYLRALDDAETFLYSHEFEAKAIVQRRLNMTDDYIENMWSKNQFGLSLDQGLILAMEDEARWMAEQNMTGGRTTPSYLDMIYQDAMREVKPSAVTIIR